MSLNEFREYVESSGVNFNVLTNEEKRQWRETFDKSKNSAASPSGIFIFIIEYR